MGNIGYVTIPVYQFVANSSAYPCEPYCVLAGANAVYITDDAKNSNGDPQIGYDPYYYNQLWMQKKNSSGKVDLELTFVKASDTSIVYEATGEYAFVQSQGNQDPTGQDNFSKVAGTAGAIRLRNKFKHKGSAVTWPQTCPGWEFYIQIKDSSGKKGWIDPGVENSDDF